MAHLSKLGLENFRVFKEMTEFEFAPITILTGPNSSGKSSVLKALLLLKNNLFENKFEILDFTSGNHNLGNFKNIINQSGNSVNVTFRLPFSFNGINEKMQIDLVYTLDDKSVFFNGKLIGLNLFIGKKQYIVKAELTKSGWNFWFDFTYFRTSYNELISLKKEEVKYDIYDIYRDIKLRNKFWYLDENESFNDKQIVFDADISSCNLKDKEYNPKEDKFSFIGIDSRPLSDLPFILAYDHDETNFLEETSEYLKNMQNSFFKHISDIFKYKTKEELIKLFYEDELKLIQTFNYTKAFNKDPHTLHSEFYESNLHASLDDYFSSVMNIKNDTIGNYSIKHKSIIKEFIISQKSTSNAANYLIAGELPYKFINFIKIGFLDSLKKTNSILSNLFHLDAVRANTQRIYTHNSQGTGFNDLIIEFSKLNLHQASDEVKFINNWLKEFGIKDSLTISPLEIGFGSGISFGDSQLADLGYGITQFLPILLTIVIRARKNYNFGFIAGTQIDYGYHSSILYIEEPETNLHPKLQSKLADMFVDASKKFHIQFILETHSEYLVRKLQYLTAKKELDPGYSAIYYFHEPNKIPKGEKQVKKLTIREDGMMDDDFGPGFFDEATKLTIDLLKIQNTN